MKTYEEAVDFISHIEKYSAHPGIENASRLLDALGHPERGLNIIHAAGTNGKGSVCAFLADMLTAQGCRVGLFISPHLVDVRERIQLDRRKISKADFTACFLRVQEAVRRLAKTGYAGVTYFDYFFAIAMCWYAECQPDYVILETGLGGRRDSTNAVEHPLLTIITSISMDHTELLGGTLAKIASEKAGIIKPGVPLIFCCDEPEAYKVIKQAALAAGAPHICIGRNSCAPLPARSGDGPENGRLTFAFRLPAPDGTPERQADAPTETLTVNSAAVYQEENAAIAYSAALWLYQLRQSALRSASGLYAPNFTCPDSSRFDSASVPDSVREGLRTALASSVWEGRFEQIAPDVYIDGAHNADGIRMLLASLRPVAGGRPVTLLFTAVKEKDTGEMIREICESGLFCRYLVTTVGGPRAVAPEQLKEQFMQHTGAPVTAYASPQEAFFAGMRETGHDRRFRKEQKEYPAVSLSAQAAPEGGIFLAAGSLYLVGIIKELLAENGEAPRPA